MQRKDDRNDDYSARRLTIPGSMSSDVLSRAAALFGGSRRVPVGCNVQPPEQKDQSIDPLMIAIMGHTVEDHVPSFTTISKNLFSNLDSTPRGCSPGAIPDNSDNISAVSASGRAR